MNKTKLHDFYHRLDKYKKINPDPEDDPYSVGRHNFCHIIFMIETKGVKYARFEVRGWDKPTRLGSGIWMLEVSAVNWTITAGTCSIHIDEDNVDNFEILEDNKALQVLIGSK